MRTSGLRMLCGGCLAALALLCAPALAGKATDNAKDGAKILEEGKLTLAAVIGAAEADTKGKACCVTVAKKDAGFVFAVHTHADGKCTVAHVDKSGKVTSKMDAKPEDCKDAKCGDASKMMTDSKLSLATAVGAAEADTKGKATAATCDGNGCMVAVVADGKVWNVTVGKDGKVGKKDEEKPPVKGG